QQRAAGMGTSQRASIDTSDPDGDTCMNAMLNVLSAMQDMQRPFIFNLGHGLTPQVPPENVAALVEFVQCYR
ncbi:MAG: hypothetical protein EB059_04755, partial [Alphaproteobacteria bacterium]|nr:hypothetical protein [Alphaproteobacteria bacterium]